MTALSDPDWRTRAVCAADPDAMHPLRSVEAVQAVRMCNSPCPVRDACYADAKAMPDAWRRSLVAGGSWWNASGTERRYPIPTQRTKEKRS